MESIEQYQIVARELTSKEFAARYAHPFLVKHPSNTKRASRELPAFGFATSAVNLSVDPVPGLIQVAAVRKRDGNPFPDRLSIGRAPNCDVVLRLPLVSKVHAHLLVQADGSYVLRDNKASNGTFHNHRALEPDDSKTVRLGDSIGFGSLELELVDAARLYDILLSRV
jgi:hypothetical protein